MQQKSFLILYGRDANNTVFRPSDWAERIYDLHGVFSPNCKHSPTLVRVAMIDHTRCLKIDQTLESINVHYWNYIVDFAASHQLQTNVVAETVMTTKEIVVEKARCLYSAWLDKLSAAVSRPFKEKLNAN